MIVIQHGQFLTMISQSPGTGKTTASAAAVLAMNVKFGQILCSGPTNPTIDNYAQKIDEVARSVTQRCRTTYLYLGYCRPMIVRGYKMSDELHAFKHLLEFPEDSEAELFSEFQRSAWRLPFSVTYWALVVLESSAVDAIPVDDIGPLSQLCQDVHEHPRWICLREVAGGGCSWSDFLADRIRDGEMLEFLAAVVDAADILCATSAQLAAVPYKLWKKTKARAVAVDEAGSMNRPELYGIWGNTALPIFLSGDDRQFAPLVLSKMVMDGNDHPVHRFAKDGQLSQMRAMQGMGMPVYRLKQQLRMANGMFDIISKIMYPDVPLSYNATCDVSLEKFDIGRHLEAFMCRHFEQLSSPRPGKMLPVFVHCHGAKSIINEITGSARCSEQSLAALRLAARFVDEDGVDPARIRFLSPYAATVREIRDKLERFPQLQRTGPPSTVDSFQGHESDIVMLVMGVAGRRPGPEFVAEEARINVMMTRQRCGLVIVGDNTIAGSLDTPNDEKIRITTAWGDENNVKAPSLKRLFKELVSLGRSVRITDKFLEEVDDAAE